MQRILQLLDRREPERESEYWVVSTRDELFVVTHFTARAIERALDRVPAPTWITFRERAGARHRLRSVLIERISECCAEHRAAWRAWRRARDAEEAAESTE